jgi:histidinol-phosphatase
LHPGLGSDVTPQAWLAFLLELAQRADAIALTWFRRDGLGVGIKADQTPVTAADLEIERTVRTLALARHAHLALLGEEYGATEPDGTRLIVDPIDGTANFARGIPLFATLLAIEHDGELLAGVASAPALGTRWAAARGAGAFRNGARIRVSSIDRLGAAQIFHGGFAGTEQLLELPGLMQLLRAGKRERGFGDFYQHVLVAEGAGEVAIDVRLAPWDIAALAIIVEEAGGRATALSGKRDIHAGSLVSTNSLLHDQALAVLVNPQP